jgi:hypothetical protein
MSFIGKRKKQTNQQSVEETTVTPKRVSPQQQFDVLEEKYRDIIPKNWDELSMSAKLDWFGHRMLLDIREEMNAQGNKEHVFLSEYQLERRRRREVQSKLNGWDDIPPKAGVFRRVHVDKNNMLTGNQPKPEDNNGQKNP